MHPVEFCYDCGTALTRSEYGICSDCEKLLDYEEDDDLTGDDDDWWQSDEYDGEAPLCKECHDCFVSYSGAVCSYCRADTLDAPPTPEWWAQARN